MGATGRDSATHTRRACRFSSTAVRMRRGTKYAAVQISPRFGSEKDWHCALGIRRCPLRSCGQIAPLSRMWGIGSRSENIKRHGYLFPSEILRMQGSRGWKKSLALWEISYIITHTVSICPTWVHRLSKAK